MAIDVTCECGKRLKARDEHAGKRARCPSCGNIVSIPDGDTAAERSASGELPWVVPSSGPPEQIGTPLGTAGPEEQVRASDSPSTPPSGEVRFGRSLPKLDSRQLLYLGFVLVIIARGCDGLGSRAAARLNAKYDTVRNRFEDKWDQQRLQVEQELREEDYSTRRERLDQMRERQQREREELENGQWRSLKIAARDAAANNRMWSYWYQWLFVLGSVVLIVGLLSVGFTGKGAERWICLIMLAIITFSIYVGGIAWVQGTVGSLERAGGL